jgi:TolB-like protein/Tfp pilus assembly protein PilF
MRLVTELRRRNVLRMAVLYVIAAWLIMQVTEVVKDLASLPGWVGPTVLGLLAIGFPIALIFSWFYELTPEGIALEKDIQPGESMTHVSGRRLDFIVISLLCAAVILFAYDKWWTPDPPDRSVAVLPFVNMSGSADTDYFSDGLTETLLHTIARLPDLKVPARTSVFFFKGQDTDVSEIAEQLGVSNLLEGSVQRDGNKVRIVAQLIEAETGFSLWSDTYDREMSDVFAVQDDIANSVAEALQVALLGAAPATPVASLATRNTQAYEKYLQALEQKNIASYGSLAAAEGLFKEALSLDPYFAEATVELAKTYNMQAETGLLTYEEATARIRPLLDQALRLDPDDGRALGMLAALDWAPTVLAYGLVSEQASRVEAEMLRAIELAPSDADLYVAMANIATNANRNEESLDWIDKGLAVDPLSARLHLQRGGMLLETLERPEEAAESFARAHEILPRWTAATSSAGEAAFAMGNFADGISWYLHTMSLDPQDHETPAMISRIYYQLGMWDEGDAMLRQAQALAPQVTFTRSVQLERHLLADNYERAVLLAEQMIRDEVENRRGAYDMAVSGYVSSMIELGQSERVAKFFESVQPGISSVDYQPRGARDSSMQFFLVMALLDSGAYEVANAKMETLIALADDVVPGWRDNHDTMAVVAVARGDRKAAIEHALEDMEESLGRRAGWNINYQHTAWMKPLLKDTRIAERIAELQALTQDAATEVRDMLAKQRPEKG